ncbi:MAG: signal peptidase I [Thermoleophilaceae bacterium]
MAVTGKKRRLRGKTNPYVELVVIVAVALLLALGIQAVLVKPFRIPSESMVPTLAIGQRVLVDRVSGHWSDPKRGDVVVFKPPKGADQNSCGVQQPSGEACPTPTPARSSANFIKRVVAIGGDRIKIINNRVWLNGRLQSEPFINPHTPCGDPLCNLPREITVPTGSFFMMGDNRGQSADSREWGPVPRRWLIGRAFFTYWPLGRIGTL